MPLKVVTRKGREYLYIRGTYKGQKIYECAGTGDRARAEDYRVKREAEIWHESLHGKQATKTFADAAASYLTAEPRALATVRAVKKLLVIFGRYDLASIGQDSLDVAYKRLLRDGVHASSATKIRAVITPLSAILTHGAVMGWCARPAFKKPRVAKTTTNFLLPAQADALIRCAAPHLQPLLTFLIGTGCRMSEALELQWERVDLRGARAVVWQKQDNERRIDLPPRVVAALAALPGRDGHVFRPVLSRALPGRERARHGSRGKRVGESYRTGGSGGGQIKRAWATACRDAGLPGRWREWTPRGATKPKKEWVSEITPHDCRHTFASWHYCMHRDLIRLMQEGGWTTLSMVQRYTHMMPVAYRDEILAWFEAGPVEIRREA